MARPRSLIGRLFRSAGLLIACTLGLSLLGLADENTANQKDGKKVVPKNPAKAEKAAAKRAAVVTAKISPEREAAALEFAQQNHPEMAALLQGLKQNSPKAYQDALTELDQTVEKLAKLKEKSPERYEFMLSEWKITSRIRLLAARLSMNEDPGLESELRGAIRERFELRLVAQQTERDRLQKRLDRLNQTIDSMTTNSDALIEKQLTELKRTMPAPKTAGKSKTKTPKAAGQVDVKGEK